MPISTRRRAKGRNIEHFDRELEAARAEEDAHAQALADLIRKREQARKKREALEEQRRELEEEERHWREQERRMRMSRRSESAERFANRAWEKMDGVGECTECSRLGDVCYRFVNDPNDTQAANTQWFLIGGVYYSRCQECKERRRKCALKDGSPPTSVPTQPSIRDSSISPSKRKREDSTPPPEIKTSDPTETKSTEDEPKPHLPTPSSVAEFVQGSSSRPLTQTKPRSRKSREKRRRLRKLEEDVAGLNGKVADILESQREMALLVKRLTHSTLAANSKAAEEYEYESDHLEDELEYTDGE